MRSYRAAWLFALFYFALNADAGTIYVAATGDDSNAGTQVSPVKTIQRGLDLAAVGDTVSVGNGTFIEHIQMNKNNVKLVGSGPANTILLGTMAKLFVEWEASAAVVDVSCNTVGIEIREMTIARDYHGIFFNPGSGGLVENNRLWGSFLNNVTIKDAEPTIRKNLILGRSPHTPAWMHAFSGVDIWTASRPIIENNTFNDFKSLGVCSLNSAKPVIRNNIISGAPIGIATPDSSSDKVFIDYNNVWGNGANYDGVTRHRNGMNGNISADPVWVDTPTYNYSLRSCSPSIDAGHPGRRYRDPDSTRNDQGAFYFNGARQSLLPPSNLQADADTGRRVHLKWEPSPSSSVQYYNIYQTTDENLKYRTPVARVSKDTPTWTSGVLPAVVHKFGVRASDGVCEEPNTDVTVVIKPEDTPNSVRAVVRWPPSGVKISGNHVFVKGHLIRGRPRDVTQILFQYRRVDFCGNDENDDPDDEGGRGDDEDDDEDDNSADSTCRGQGAPLGAWTDMVPTAPLINPNPQRFWPYFIFWNVKGLRSGRYELRAVASSGAGADPNPPTKWVRINHRDPDFSEDKPADGRAKRKQLIHNTVKSVIEIGEPGRNSVASLTMEAGALNDPSVTVDVETRDADGLQASAIRLAGLSSHGPYLDITLSNGQTDLLVPATLVMSYDDTDQNGIVDGTDIPEEILQMRYFDTSSNVWKLVEGAQTVDAAANTLTAITPHFTTFGLFSSVAAANLNALQVFPSPFVPNDGDPDNGRPFSSADASSGIVFDQVTDAVKIRVFDVTGRSVWNFDSSNSGGRVQWDVRNNDGRDVASGVYFAVIEGNGQTVSRKFAVVR